ncbi:scopoletin glucosyltransferase [Phtheirospermum japonicum]|uniref:Glycosyltransferase n=1 Tax=Phtheirospermum japonicum TaxID=374723 RepID=A0A830BKI7_9LAMI|nr:scopoletin glucosyltransferase [Phtheirospermum japonicum]
MAHGHMIPTLDMAKLFTSRGLKTTIIATPSFAHSIKKAQESGHNIGLSIINFPPEKSSLPKNILSLDQVSTPDMLSQFFRAVSLLQEPVEKLLHELNPNCLVSDTFLPWTDGFLPWTFISAAKLGIPRLVFHGISCFALCASEQMDIHKPYRNVLSDSEPFVLPNLPHQLTFVRTQLPLREGEDEDESPFAKLKQQMKVSDEKSYGVIINSFHELEPAYADHYKNRMGKKAWHIGPLLLCNQNNERLAQRGKESSIDEHKCLAWLDSKRPDSVVYVCFGSMVTFTPAQLHETAVGLEASGQDFIWVVRRGKHEEDEKNEDWLPQGFEERTKGKGLIIRGWAPQVMILDHPSIGAFVTHCGWNSTLEGICAGVPMVTWPAFAEQFYNEKMVTEVLGTGVSVGNKKWEKVGSEGVPRRASEGVLREAVKKAVRRIMVGEVAKKMRIRAKCYKEMARKAVKEGGSSYSDLNALIDELSIYVPPKKQDTN